MPTLSRSLLSLSVFAILLIVAVNPGNILKNVNLLLGFKNNSNAGIPYASAAAVQDEMKNWANWPSSYRLKGFNGGWIMPFDFYELAPYRPTGVLPDEAPRVPVFMDINGDSLVDMLFSSTQDFFIQNGGGYSSFIETQQYIALNNGSRFNLVYKCRYGADAGSVNFRYYGDCADTAASQTPIQKHPPRFPVEMILHQQGKIVPVNKDSPTGNIAASKNIHVNISTPVLHEYCNNKNGSVATSCDRHMPRFMDLNGDGLQDIILSGTMAERYYYFYPQYTDRKVSMILYNNGNGFDLDHLCYEIADINTTAGSLYADLGFKNTYSPWPSQINPAAQTYYCLLGNP